MSDIHDDWSDLAGERLDRIEELTDRLSTLVDERDQANAAVARLLHRAETAEQRLAMVRNSVAIANRTIERLQAEIDRFEPVTDLDEIGIEVPLNVFGRPLFTKAAEQ